MTTYILLRSNKESGPFSLDQLADMGLKPNDLIWVEGQSASWRNPQEIKELVNLTKTPVQASIPTPVEAVVGNQETREEKVEPAEVTTRVCNKKSVFVSMPGGKTAESQEGSRKAEPVYKETAPLPAVEKPKEEVETKYAMSLDEIKQRYIRSLEDRKSKKRPVSIEVPENIKKIAVYAGVFILGAAIVLLLVRPDKTATIASGQTKLPAKFDTHPLDESSGSETDPSDGVVMPESYYDSRSKPETNEGKQVTRTKTKSPVSSGQEESAETLDEENNQGSEEDADHRTSIPKNEKPEVVSIATSDISDQVSVKTNSYTIAALGGIRDLELTVRNSSDFTLDKVTVEVRYLNPNGNIVKTEDVDFRSIQPNGVQTKGMKKTSRGVKVTYRILRIESREAATGTVSSLKVN